MEIGLNCKIMSVGLEFWLEDFKFFLLLEVGDLRLEIDFS